MFARDRSIGTILAVLSAGALSSSLIGCPPLSEGECDEGETKCEDNVALTCAPPCSDPGCGRRWEREPCGAKTCIVPNGLAARCETSPVEDPRCRNHPYCSGDQVVTCVGQYAIRRSFPCGSEGCVEMADTAACRVPFDEECLGGVPLVCSGNDSVSCENGRITGRTTCSQCVITTGECAD